MFTNGEIAIFCLNDPMIQKTKMFFLVFQAKFIGVRKHQKKASTAKNISFFLMRWIVFFDEVFLSFF